MSYIDQHVIRNVLHQMREYHEEQKILHDKFNMNFTENLGRRNVIMSHPQEHFLALELSKHYDGVVNDGRPGYPDVHIGALNRELECKLTTSSSRGHFSFKTDYATLQNKGKLDYLYILASPEFNDFCVLHFLDLTADDFPEPCATARGKSSMSKSRGMQKCHVLWGEVKTHVELQHERTQLKLSQLEMQAIADINAAQARLDVLEQCVQADQDPVTQAKIANSKRRTALKQQLRTAQNKPSKLYEIYLRQQHKLTEKLTASNVETLQYTYNLHSL